mgnify:CR=1 FL=1
MEQRKAIHAGPCCQAFKPGKYEEAVESTVLINFQCNQLNQVFCFIPCWVFLLLFVSFALVSKRTCLQSPKQHNAHWSIRIKSPISIVHCGPNSVV